LAVLRSRIALPRSRFSGLTKAASTARSVCRKAVSVFAATGVVGAGRRTAGAFDHLPLVVFIVHAPAAVLVARRLLLARGQARR
jgi:hypothetical protein